MYEIPSNDKIQKVTITKECIKDGALPEITAAEKRAAVRGEKIKKAN